jgi:WD40 repeat protein
MIGGVLQAANSGSIIESVAFNKTGTVLATGADDKKVRLFDTSALPSSGATAGAVLTGFNGYVSDVAFGPDGQTLAAASVDRTVRLWHVTDATHATLLGRPLTGFTGYVYSVAFNPRQPILAVGSSQGTVQLFNIANPRDPISDGSATVIPSGYVYSIAFNSTGTVLAGAVTNGNLLLWDVADPRSPAALATLTSSAKSLFTVAFDPAGSRSNLADGGEDGVVRIWQTDAALAEQQLCAGIGQPLGPSDWEEVAPGLPFISACR